jgi:bifunctional DNase/RNase
MREAEIWTITQVEEGNAVLLRPLGSGVAVPIFIGSPEARSILTGLGGVIISRPLTHDLLLNLIRQLGFNLVRVEIHDLRDDIFYARLVVAKRGDSEFLILDSRPSDALALAVRAKCPILIDDKIVIEVGVPAEFIIDAALEKGETPEKMSKREALAWELEGAVAAEAYERAAEIRNLLRRLDEEAEEGGD